MDHKRGSSIHIKALCNRTTKRLHNATHELGLALAARLRLGSLFAEFVLLVRDLSYFFIPVVCSTH